MQLYFMKQTLFEHWDKIKRLLIFLIVILTALCIPRKEIRRNQALEIPQEDIPVLSPKRWVRMLPGIWGYEIKFFNDGTFDAFFLAEPTVKCTKGRFIQNLNKVSLFSEFKGIIEFRKDRSWCRKIRGSQNNSYAAF